MNDKLVKENLDKLVESFPDENIKTIIAKAFALGCTYEKQKIIEKLLK